MAAIEGKITMTTCEGRPCWVRGRRAIFHRWTDSARPVKPVSGDQDTDERLQKWSVHGLVEYEDGRMEREWPNNIRFADSAEKFDSLAWEQMEARRDALPYEYSQEVAEAATKAEPRTCITCGYDRILESHCMNIDYRCDQCWETDCRCKDCQDADKWMAKGAAPDNVPEADNPDCQTCAHNNDDLCSEYRAGTACTCTDCPAWECICQTCKNSSKWEPKGGAV